MMPAERPAARVTAPVVGVVEVRGMRSIKVPAAARPEQYQGQRGGNLSERAGPVSLPSMSPTANTEIIPAL